MADMIHFELVTPTKLLFAEVAEMVVVPGGDGDFGVLAGHAPLIATVRPGTIDIYDGAKVTHQLFVERGFAEVTAERCTVLAEEAMPLEDLDRETAEERRQTAITARDAATGNSERAAAEQQVLVADAMLAAVDATGRGARA